MRKCLMTNVQHKFCYGVKSKCRHDLSRLLNLHYWVNHAKVRITKRKGYVKDCTLIAIDITVTYNCCGIYLFKGTILIDTFSVKPQNVELNLLYIPTCLLISFCQQKHFQYNVRCITYTVFFWKIRAPKGLIFHFWIQ